MNFAEFAQVKNLLVFTSLKKSVLQFTKYLLTLAKEAPRQQMTK